MLVFGRDLFRDPANEYRPLQIVHGLDGALLDPKNLVGEEGIDRRLRELQEMGIGGIIANVGSRDNLTSPRQWRTYRYGMRKAAEMGLVLWLYDEKGYPSGSAGGIVSRAHPEYVTLGLASYPQGLPALLPSASTCLLVAVASSGQGPWPIRGRRLAPAYGISPPLSISREPSVGRLRPPAVPWAEDLLSRFEDLKGYDLRPYLFELFVSESEEACGIRQDYYGTISRLYTEAFPSQIRRWCDAHGIACSGHVMAEENLVAHVAYQGSLFAVIREMGLPGIDMLNSDPQDMLSGEAFMAAKQLSSEAHLTGARQIQSECSDWVQANQGRSATLAEGRGQGNLQYVLGVNQITSSFDWDDIAKDGIRQYHNYMARLASLLTGGTHHCDLAVLYPIRTAWAHYTPLDRPYRRPSEGPERADWLEPVGQGYPDLVRYLLRHQIDLDVFDEEAVTTAKVREGALCVAGERYKAVLLPPLHALGLATAQALVAFAWAGGRVISVGPLPGLAESTCASTALRQEMTTLFGPGGPGSVIAMGDIPAYLNSQLASDFSLTEQNPDILYTHRQLEERDLCFIVNNGPNAVTVQPILGRPGPYTLYWPLDASMQGTLSLDLAGCEGLFLVCHP